MCDNYPVVSALVTWLTSKELRKMKSHMLRPFDHPKFIANLRELMNCISLYFIWLISEFVENSPDSSGGFLNWNLHVIWNLNERDLPQVADLLAKLGGVRLNNVINDRRIWKADSSEVLFWCRSAFYALIACDVSPRAVEVSSLWRMVSSIFISRYFSPKCSKD